MDQHFGNHPRSLKAFTIIELLVVIAIIAILAGIFFGVSRGVNERSRISRAQTELSLLAQYLEQYKSHYGDYPRVTLNDSNSSGGNELEGEQGIVALYEALNGLRAIDGQSFDPATERQRAFIDRGKFRYEFSPSQNPPSPSNPEIAPVALIDPWGNTYRYYYAPPPVTSGWENPSYVLYSVGPSGEHEPPTNTGFSDREDPKNLDNVYAN